MMKMGLISLLLTVSEVPISKICVSQRVANSFLPCENPLESAKTAASSVRKASSSSAAAAYESNTTSFYPEITSENYCKSKVI